MADIFISYSSKDRALAEALAARLHGHGFTVWWDTQLIGGEIYRKTILAELSAAKAVFVIWTEQSVESDWVYDEATRAWKAGKLIPLRVPELNPDAIHPPFGALQTLLYSDEDGALRALGRLALHAKAETKLAVTSPRPIVTAAGNVFAQPSVTVNQAPLRDGKVRVMVGAGGDVREMWLKPGESFRDFEGAPEMVVVPPGKFWMGSRDGEGGADERPRHEVTIPNAFAVGKYPVTFDEWDAYVADNSSGTNGFLGFGKGKEGHNPSDNVWGRGKRPVINVHWKDAQAYLAWLNCKVSGKPYRLLKAYDGDIQIIDSSSIRVHQHAANGKKKTGDPVAWAARAAA